MECFHRNETLHQNDSVCDLQNRKALGSMELARGMAYATQNLERKKSPIRGFNDVCNTYASRTHPDCRCPCRSCLRRPRSPDQSFLQSEASSADADDSLGFRNASHRHQGSRGEMGPSAFARRAECIRSNRSRRWYVVDPRIGPFGEFSERGARVAHGRNHRRRERSIRRLHDATPRATLSQTCDRGSRSSEHSGIWN